MTTPRDKAAGAGLNYGERSEAIVLELEQPIRVVERLASDG
jgi:hypothetical protein